MVHYAFILYVVIVIGIFNLISQYFTSQPFYETWLQTRLFRNMSSYFESRIQYSKSFMENMLTQRDPSATGVAEPTEGLVEPSPTTVATYLMEILQKYMKSSTIPRQNTHKQRAPSIVSVTQPSSTIDGTKESMTNTEGTVEKTYFL